MTSMGRRIVKWWRSEKKEGFVMDMELETQRIYTNGWKWRATEGRRRLGFEPVDLEYRPRNGCTRLSGLLRRLGISRQNVETGENCSRIGSKREGSIESLFLFPLRLAARSRGAFRICQSITQERMSAVRSHGRLPISLYANLQSCSPQPHAILKRIICTIACTAYISKPPFSERSYYHTFCDALCTSCHRIST
jgi:hypothetical protein